VQRIHVFNLKEISLLGSYGRGKDLLLSGTLMESDINVEIRTTTTRSPRVAAVFGNFEKGEKWDGFLGPVPQVGILIKFSVL
jgi:hypothetical protein